MQTIRITTSQNIEIDYEIAGLGERMLATLIDFAIFFLITMSIIIVNAMMRDGGGTVFYVSLIVTAVVYVFYDPACEIFMNGQSIGKRVMKMKVISLDGGQAGVGQYLLRWVFKIIDFTLTSAACAVISAAVTEKSQRLGDIVAGTALIRTEPRATIDSLAFVPPVKNYTPVFYEVAQLSDKDIVLVHEVLNSYIKSGNLAIVDNTASKLKQVLNIDTNMDNMRLLQTIISDYNYIAANAEVI
jgi:uncharacterized RDD family membrane protein YckC